MEISNYLNPSNFYFPLILRFLLRFKGQLLIPVITAVIALALLYCNFWNDADSLPVSRSTNLLYNWALAEITFLDGIRNANSTRLKEQSFGIRLNLFIRSIWSQPKQPSFGMDLVSYIEDFEDANKGLRGYEGLISERAAAVAHNPIASYRMIRRVAYHLPDLMIQISDFDAQKLNWGYFFCKMVLKPVLEGLRTIFAVNLNLWPNTFPSGPWLSSHDVNDSMHGILRVHNVYDINIELFVDGIVAGISTGAKLHGVHCYEIGVYAHQQNFHTLSIQWLALALAKSDIDETVEKGLIESALRIAQDSHDMMFDNRSKYDPYYFTTKFSEITDASEVRETQRKRLVREYKGRMESDFNDINFWELCSNGAYKSAEDQSKLFCWYETKVHVYWLIGPLKMEMLTTNPDLYQVYDVIGDQKIAKLQEVATKTLSMSKVVDVKNPGESIVSKIRTSMNAWIDEFLYPELASIPFTIQQITGINVVKYTSSEKLQIASYAFSGHYGVHLDAFKNPKRTEDKGDRIATFMFYLSDVEAGGYTAFPRGGVAAVPVKGSAVFWYGIHTDGAADYHTYHGACPIILGTKWVANKWIRYYDQFLLRKCSLQPQDRYRVAINGV